MITERFVFGKDRGIRRHWIGAISRFLQMPLQILYFSYWVALEVAADTHSAGKIATLLLKGR